MPPPRPPPLPALTGVRFLAALHVVLYHFGTGALAGAPAPLRAILATGPAAVSLFYVLSGAVLTYSCTGEDGALAGSRRAFWRARFARIYPTYLLAQAIDGPGFAASLLKGRTPLEALVRGLWQGPLVLLLVHAWLPRTVFAWNVPGWSISCEAFFYAIFPAAVRRLRSGSPAKLLARGGALWLLSLGPPLLAFLALRSRAPWLDHYYPPLEGSLVLREWAVRLCGFSPAARASEFLLGICLGHWLRAQHAAGVRLAPARALALEAAALLPLTAALVALGSWAQAKPWLDSGLLAPLFALLVAALALGGGPLARLLGTRPFQTLGDASFALYILQEPLVTRLNRVPGYSRCPPLAGLALLVAVLVAASIACHRLLAEPARRRLLARS